MIRLTPLAAALLTLFVSPLPVFAQEAPTANVPDPAVPSIVIRGAKSDFVVSQLSLSKLPADLHDIAQSVTVVNKALMQSQGANSMVDALRNVAGITLGGAEGGQIGNNVNLNGFTARTDIYLDGFRDRGQYYRDTFALDAIEVLMGPSSMLFGRGSTGGVINQVTKKPILKEQAEVGFSATNNGLLRVTLDQNTPLSDSSAVRFMAMGQEGDASTRNQSKLEDYALAPSVKFGIGTPTEITLSALLQHNNDMPDYGVSPLNGHPVPVPRNMAYGYNDDHTESSVAALNGTVIHKLTPDITLRNQVQFNYVQTDAIETAPNAIGVQSSSATGFTATPNSSAPLSSLYERLQSHDRNIRDYSLFNQTELLAQLSAGGFKHKLLAGLELGHDGYDNQAYYRNGTCNGKNLNAAGATTGYVACVPLLSGDNGNSPASVSSQAGNHAGGSANTAAAYLNDTIELSPVFKLAAGLRYDHYAASISNSFNAQTVAGSTALPSARQELGFTSVRLGGIWQPRAAHSYYLSYGTSFNPSLEQLVGTTGQQNLAPEKNHSYEAGGKWDVAHGDLALNAALFQITKENARSLISAGVYELDGTVRVNGLRGGATGRLNQQWQVALNYTHLDAKITGASAADNTLGKTPANTPKNTVTVWNTYAVAPHWEAGGGAVYMGQRYASSTNVVSVGGYTRLDATLAYQRTQYAIRLNVFNLANRMYDDALIPSDGGRAVPGAGRSMMVSLNYRF